MNRDPRTKTELCATTERGCYHYSGSIPYFGRDVVKNSVVFQIGTPDKIYFEGRAEDEWDRVSWKRLSGATLNPGDIETVWNARSGYFQIVFHNRDLVQDGEQITVSYDWQPHPLSGAEVLVKVNNEERFVPIEELQHALHSYLGE